MRKRRERGGAACQATEELMSEGRTQAEGLRHTTPAVTVNVGLLPDRVSRACDARGRQRKWVRVSTRMHTLHTPASERQYSARPRASGLLTVHWQVLAAKFRR